MKKELLNGIWQFATDRENAGEKKAWYAGIPAAAFEVTVPHVWQNVNDELFLYTGTAWYFREFTAAKPAAPLRKYLCFNAVDYSCLVWLNGRLLGRHDGGYLSFSFDITDYLQSGSNFLALKVVDPLDNSEIPIGKQGTWYTRVSGIWQDVFLTERPASHIESLRLFPDIDTMTAQVEVAFSSCPENGVLYYEVAEHLGGVPLLAGQRLAVTAAVCAFTLPLEDAKLWSPESPALYELRCTLSGPGGEDAVTEIFGLRNVEQKNGRVYLNNKPLYIRGALDQGFYPQTVYMAPDEEIIKREIESAKEMGFNLLRKHIKVELPRYLYWADRLGLLLWCEAPSYIKWCAQSRRVYEDCLFSMIKRDFNHPSIIIWSIYNEEWGLEWSLAVNEEMRSYLADLYGRLKQYDPSRLLCDNSGWTHVRTDINDYHPYTALPDQEVFWKEFLATLDPQKNYVGSYKYRGEVNMISEFGMWGLPELSTMKKDYGGKMPLWFDNRGAALKDPVHNLEFKVPATAPENFKKYRMGGIFSDFDEFARLSQKRMMRGFKALIENIRRTPLIGGYVITEFTDVEWETNGMLDYFRRPKLGYGHIPDFNGSLAVMFENFEHNLISARECVLTPVLCNDAAQNCRGVLRWRVAGTDLGGELPVATAKPLTVFEKALSFTVPAVMKPGFYTLEIELVDENGEIAARNKEELTFSPAMHDETAVSDKPGIFVWGLNDGFVGALKKHFTLAGTLHPGIVAVTDTLDDKILSFCYEGGSAVFLAEGGIGLPFKGDFTLRQLNTREDWNRASAFNYIDAKLFSRIPLNREVGWEAQHLFPDFVVPFSDYRRQGGRIVHMTGNHEIAQNCRIIAGFAQAWLGQFGATMLEYPYGKGRIFMTTYKLMANYEKQPIGTRLLDALILQAHSPAQTGR